jgi:hypothetical protein
MNCVRPKAGQQADSAAAALTGLVRLLARQAAREWFEGTLESASSPAGEASERQK